MILQPEAYLFDLDGTLIDTAPDLSNALNHALAAAGIAPVTEALTRHWVGHGVRAMLAAAFEHHDLEQQEDRFEEFVAVLLTHYERHIADCSRPYPSVVETLKALGERAPLAVVTNKPFRFTELLLEALDLTRHFATVIGGDTATKPKPAPEPALLACERLGSSPASALFVGDSATDVGCARAAGCPVVVYRHGYNHGIDPDSLGADAVIDSFDELLGAPLDGGRASRPP